MSNAISMPDKRPARRSPWRGLLMLLLLAAAVIYGYTLYLQAQRQQADTQRREAFAIAGPLAEGFELALIETSATDPRQAMAELIGGAFPESPELAAVRVWDHAMALLCEVTRAEPEVTRAGEGGALEPLGITTAVMPVNARLQEQAWTDAIAKAQLLQMGQLDLIERYDLTAKDTITAKMRRWLADDQQQVLELARASNDEGFLDEVIADMEDVLALTAEPASTPAALNEALETASVDLTDALTTFRAATDTLDTLPALLADAAPPSGGWGARLQPRIRGERVIIPLFTPSQDANLSVHYGFAEFLIYARPGQAIDAFLGMNWRRHAPLIALLLLALVLAVWPRRRGNTPAHAAQRPPVTPG